MGPAHPASARQPVRAREAGGEQSGDRVRQTACGSERGRVFCYRLGEEMETRCGRGGSGERGQPPPQDTAARASRGPEATWRLGDRRPGADYANKYRGAHSQAGPSRLRRETGVRGLFCCRCPLAGEGSGGAAARPLPVGFVTVQATESTQQAVRCQAASAHSVPGSAEPLLPVSSRQVESALRPSLAQRPPARRSLKEPRRGCPQAEGWCGRQHGRGVLRRG